MWRTDTHYKFGENPFTQLTVRNLKYRGLRVDKSCQESTKFKNKQFHPKKSKRKVQGVPQSQTAALPRPQEEEETDKSKQAQIEQTYEKH